VALRTKKFTVVSCKLLVSDSEKRKGDRLSTEFTEAPDRVGAVAATTNTEAESDLLLVNNNQHPTPLPPVFS